MQSASQTKGAPLQLLRKEACHCSKDAAICHALPCPRLHLERCERNEEALVDEALGKHPCCHILGHRCYLCRDAVQEPLLACASRIAEYGCCDKARRDDEAMGIERGISRMRCKAIAHIRNPAAFDADIGAVARLPRAVDHNAIPYKQRSHGGPPFRIADRKRIPVHLLLHHSQLPFPCHCSMGLTP